MVEFQRGPGLGVFEWKHFYDDVRRRLSDVVRQDYALQLLNAAIISTSSVGVEDGGGSRGRGGIVRGGSARNRSGGTFSSSPGSARGAAAFGARLARGSSDGTDGRSSVDGGYMDCGRRVQGAGIDLGVGLVRSRATGGQTWLQVKRKPLPPSSSSAAFAAGFPQGGSNRKRKEGNKQEWKLKAIRLERTNTC